MIPIRCDTRRQENAILWSDKFSNKACSLGTLSAYTYTRRIFEKCSAAAVPAMGMCTFQCLSNRPCVRCTMIFFLSLSGGEFSGAQVLLFRNLHHWYIRVQIWNTHSMTLPPGGATAVCLGTVAASARNIHVHALMLECAKMVLFPFTELTRNVY